MEKSKIYKEIEQAITSAHQEGITLDQAERLAAKTLSAQIQVSEELTSIDLQARMAKSSVKAIKAAVYINIVGSVEKKPTEAAISAIIDSDELVTSSQNTLDKFEVDRDSLHRYYDIFREAHIYFRGVAKGKFE